MPISKISKISKSFECKTCNYVCSKNSEYTKHLNTAKHKRITNGNYKYRTTNFTHVCDCGKEYKYASGLSRHKPICKNIESQTNNIDSTDKESLIFALLAQNKELMAMLQEQSRTIQDITPRIGGTTTNHITNNNANTTNNNKFNLQVFLNEDCKDAINFSEFIENIKVTVEDLENQAQLGYVGGISKMFIENMKELGVNRRPIHCTDKKRNTLYIKENDEWDKEGSQEQLLHGIKVITGRTHQTLCDMKEENPGEYSDMDSDFSNKCINIQRSLLPGFPRETTFGKVIGSISDGSVVDKDT